MGRVCPSAAWSWIFFQPGIYWLSQAQPPGSLQCFFFFGSRIALFWFLRTGWSLLVSWAYIHWTILRYHAIPASSDGPPSHSFPTQPYLRYSTKVSSRSLSRFREFSDCSLPSRGPTLSLTQPHARPHRARPVKRHGTLRTFSLGATRSLGPVNRPGRAQCRSPRGSSNPLTEAEGSMAA